MPTPLEVFENLESDAKESIERLLALDEVLKVVLRGYGDMALVATDRRIFIFNKNDATRSKISKPLNYWDYADIEAIQHKSGLTKQSIVIDIHGVSRFTFMARFSGAQSEEETAPAFVRDNKADLSQAVYILQSLVSANQKAPSRPMESVEDRDPIDQVRRLGELRDSGFLSAEEFQRKKTEILGL